MYIFMKLIPYKDSTYLENYQIQAVSTQNSTNIKKNDFDQIHSFLCNLLNVSRNEISKNSRIKINQRQEKSSFLSSTRPIE